MFLRCTRVWRFSSASTAWMILILGKSTFSCSRTRACALFMNANLISSRFYNQTLYAGLENHIANSYANSLLQVLHFTPLVRNLALQHAATDCLSEKCLLCELGFLSDMLQKTEGSSCHASNLLKCLTNHPPGEFDTIFLFGVFLLTVAVRSLPPRSSGGRFTARLPQ